jgi:hypothetical protein
MAEGIKSSDGYKEQHSSLSKPLGAVGPAAVAAGVIKEPEAKKEEKAEVKEEKKEEKARKSRSVSRKRNSIFGNFLSSKKDEPAEAKDSAPVEATATEPATTEAAAAPLDGPTVAAAAVAAPVVDEPAKTEEKAAPAETTKPANKRNSSIFGSLSSKFGSKKAVSEVKPSSEAAPAVPAKDATTTEPVSAEAPVIPAPEASEPLATAVESPAAVPTTEVTNGVTEPEEVKPEVKPETKTEVPQKRKSSLPFGFGGKEKTAETDGEKKPSPFARIRQTIKGKSSPKSAEKAAEKAPEKTEEAAAEPAAAAAAEATAEPATTEEPAITSEAAEIPTEPKISEPNSAAPAATQQISTTA